MGQVSRPLQIVLILVLAFAAMWLVALRPKADEGGGGTSAPTPSGNAAAGEEKSALPGGLGGAADRARGAKAAGDAAAAGRSDRVDAAADDGPAAQKALATPVRKPPVRPTPAQQLAASSNGVVSAGGIAIGMFSTAVQEALGATRTAPPPRVAPRAGRTPSWTGFATPSDVRRALARGDAVVLLFYSARSPDDRAVRAELAGVDRRRGKVAVYGVSIRGLARFKNILRDVQVLQSPTVVVLGRGKRPELFPGYTDRAEIDQATYRALRH